MTLWAAISTENAFRRMGNNVLELADTWIIEIIQQGGHHVVQKIFMLIFLVLTKEAPFA